MQTNHLRSSFHTSPVRRRSFVYYKRPLPPRSGFLHKIIIFVILIILLVLGATLASIFIFGKSPKGVGERLVEINFLGKEGVNSLELNKYVISLVNKEFSDLKAAELKIDFPKGFFLVSINQPCAESLLAGCTWMLGKIRRGESRTINLEGYFLEPSKLDNDFKSFSGILNFQLEDFSSNFQKEFKKDVLVKPVLTVSLDTPEQVIVGQKRQWQIKLQNTGQQDINNSKIILEVPNGFVFIPPTTFPEGTTIAIENKRVIWLIEKLVATEELSFDGYFSQFSEQPLEFKITAGLINSDGQFFIQDEIFEQIILQAAGLIFSLSTTNNQSTFHWDEEIPIHLVYKNISNRLEDLNFKLEVPSGRLVDWQQLSNSKWQWFSEQNQIESSTWLVESKEEGRAIIWNKSQILALNQVLPEDLGEIRLAFKLIPPQQNIDNQEINFKIKASGKYSLTGEQFEIEGATLTLKIVL